jgi:hypothetical protein
MEKLTQRGFSLLKTFNSVLDKDGGFFLVDLLLQVETSTFYNQKLTVRHMQQIQDPVNQILKSTYVGSW